METTVNTNQFDGFIWPTINMWSHLAKTIKLSASARNMLDVFVAYMRPEDNLVCFAGGGMEEYIQFCEKNLHLKYSEKTIRNAISELNKTDLLLKARSNFYHVNPLFFFKWHNNLDHRRLIKDIQERTGVNIYNENFKEVHIGKKEAENTSENNIT